MRIFILLIALIVIFGCSQAEETALQTYYVDSNSGSDSNTGLSPEKAWKSLHKLSGTSFRAGEIIALAKGSVFKGTLMLKGISGTKEQPITIKSYEAGSDDFPVIDAYGYSNGILLQNCSHIIISDIAITGNGGGVKTSSNAKLNMHCGVLVTSSAPGIKENIQLKNLRIHDIFFEEEGFKRGADEVRTANGEQSYGWGIRVINQTSGSTIREVLIENCEINNVAHTGIKFTGSNKSIHQVKLHNNRVSHTGGPGMQMSGVIDAVVSNNEIKYSGSDNDSRKWGRGSGFWCWGSENILIEKNTFRKANGPGDSAGCHIDFNCNNVIVQYNLSEGNAGGFCEILGNNYNCAYRYNISINDGHRVKGENGAFQEGKIFWLSGFAGKNNPRTGPFNSYFYNNTIYVSKDIVAKIAVDRASSGVLVANNIFCFEGESQAVKGDQYKPESEGESRVEKIVFKNNVYQNSNNWPEGVLIQDTEPVYGSPQFKNPGGLNANDYLPGNLDQIKNKGIKIEKLPGDDFGLYLGLEVDTDFLGKLIEDIPDIGAIELN